MLDTPRTLVGLALAGALWSITTPAFATGVQCQRAIARAGAKYVQGTTNALRKCEEAIVRGTGGPCPDAPTTAKIAKMATALDKTIAKACGGDDGQCGGDLTNEAAPAALGWPSACPGFETSACAGAMDDCSGISQCTRCVAEAAVAQAMTLLYDDLALPSASNPALNKCQRTLGRATAKYLTTRARVLQQCWDARLAGKHSMTCPDPLDAAIAQKLAKANIKASDAVCKACGGADGTCAGNDNFTRAQIGFAFNCPAVQRVNNSACNVWNPQNGLFDLVNCALCVAEFKTDCTDRVTVPEFIAYPAGCGGGPQPSPTPQPCHGTGGLACSGDCPASQDCLPVSDGVCGCFPDGSQPCLDSGYPVCNGTCPPGDTCGTSAVVGGVCLCGNPPCGDAPYPTCGGDCPGTDQCVPGRVNGLERCWCAPAGNVCGAGTCPPFGSCPPTQVCEIPACTCGPE